jgi:hypothetical protein
LDDVEVGVLDLVEAGLLEETDTIGESIVWPLGPLYITFDPHVHDWRPAEDAKTLAATMVNMGSEQYSPTDLNAGLNWPVRRMNAALHAVKAAGLADCHQLMGGDRWAVTLLIVTAHTRRAARA